MYQESNCNVCDLYGPDGVKLSYDRVTVGMSEFGRTSVVLPLKRYKSYKNKK